MRLAAKLMLVFLAAVMLMTAVASYFTVRRSFERFERRERELARRATDEIDDLLVSAWQQGGSEQLLRALDEISPRYRQLQLRWVWFSEDTVPGGAHAGSDDRTAGVMSLLSRDESGQRHLHVYCPVPIGTGPEGGLEFTRSAESLDEDTRETITIALTSIGLMALMAFGMMYLAGLHWVARPLQRLMEKTKRVGAGDFSGPIPAGGHDELSRLAQAVNEMCDQLARQQQHIETETTRRLATMEQLRHVDRLKTVGRLAAGLAHELGTPLNVVSGRAALIASGKLSPPEVEQSAQAIKAEADRIATIIRHLLDFARQRTPRRVKTDLRELAQRTLELLRPLADKRGVTFEGPQGSEPAWLQADPGQIQQVLTNILVNAIQSMPEGGPVTVTLENRQLSPPDQSGAVLRPCWCLAVADRGEGISAENREHIFEPFFTTKDVGEGTGLGLSIAYGIVHDHGGWIDVDSEPGRGSCFTVCLPQESA